MSISSIEKKKKTSETFQKKIVIHVTQRQDDGSDLGIFIRSRIISHSR